MPELPEVENVRLQLEKYLVGHKIESVEVKTKNIFEGDASKITGTKIESVRRFGKALVIDLNNKLSLVSHIKLTGQFIYRGVNLKKTPDLSKKVAGGIGGKHTHVTFHLSDNSKLYYNDVRKFGWIRIEKTSQVENEGFIKKLGPEFLKDITYKYFMETLSKTRRTIKVLLMDQAKMAGLGNIYANDALWDAKINPKRPANSLNYDESKRLFKSCEKVLKKGLETGGASELAFVTPDGTEGDYQNHTLVYGKQGTKCKRCKTKIEKYMLGGRGTYWCPNCQK